MRPHPYGIWIAEIKFGHSDHFIPVSEWFYNKADALKDARDRVKGSTFEDIRNSEIRAVKYFPIRPEDI